MDQNKIEFRKVRDFGGLLNVTFDYIKKNFKVLFKSNLLISAPAILLAGVFMGIYQSSMFSFAANMELQQIGIPFLLSMFFMLMSYFIITVVTYSHLMVYKQSQDGIFDIDAVWQMVRKNFFTILFTGIGYTLVVGFGFILLIIPGIYLSITLSLIFIVRLEENLGFFESVGRCMRLIKDNWWFTFGLIIVVGFIQGFLMYALYIPNYIVMFFVAFTGFDSESGTLNRTLYIISSIISSLGTLAYIISTIAIAFQYYNLVEQKEAPGLLQQIDEIK
ncbi:MAG: hypothetical protein U5J96_06855 [Ignavibacteriaceae bacterium]|nr:hypothetical protein [Ignavibacteriaceae bacterium]